MDKSRFDFFVAHCLLKERVKNLFKVNNKNELYEELVFLFIRRDDWQNGCVTMEKI